MTFTIDLGFLDAMSDAQKAWAGVLSYLVTSYTVTGPWLARWVWRQVNTVDPHTGRVYAQDDVASFLVWGFSPISVPVVLLARLLWPLGPVVYRRVTGRDWTS